MLATRRPGRLWARWGLARLGGVRTLASGAGEPFSSVHSSLSTAEQAEQPLSSLGTASPRSLLSPPPQCSEDGERPLLDALSDSSLAMAADRAEQELLRPQSAAGGWMEAREARRRAARIEQAEAPETRRLLLRGHVERWLGKMRLPSDPVMLRALSHGGGWISLEALCTQPKLRLLRASPEEVAEALDGSRVVEVERRLVPQSHRSHRRSATATRSVTTDRKGTDDSVTSSKEAVFVRPFGVTLEGMLSFLARDRREKRRELGSRICPITAGALPRYNPQATVIVSRTPDAIKAAVRRVCEAVDGEAAAPGGRAVGLVVYWPDGRQWPSMISMGTPGSVEVIRLDLHYVEAENEVVDACVGAHGGRECDAAARNTSHLRGDCGPWATGLPASLMDLLTGRDVVKVGFGIEGALSRLLDAQIQAQTRGEASAAAQIAGDVDVADGHEGKLASSSSRGSRRTSWWAMVVDFAEIERRGVLADLEENMASEGSTDVLRQADASIQCITNRRENDYIDDVKRGQGISGAGDTVIEQRASPWWMMERYLGQTAPDLSPSWLARQSETADDPDEPSWGHSEDEPRESSRRHVPYKAAQLEYDDGDGEVDQLRKRVQALYFTGKQRRRAAKEEELMRRAREVQERDEEEAERLAGDAPFGQVDALQGALPQRTRTRIRLAADATAPLDIYRLIASSAGGLDAVLPHAQPPRAHLIRPTAGSIAGGGLAVRSERTAQLGPRVGVDLDARARANVTWDPPRLADAAVRAAIDAHANMWQAHHVAREASFEPLKRERRTRKRRPRGR